MQIQTTACFASLARCTCPIFGSKKINENKILIISKKKFGFIFGQQLPQSSAMAKVAAAALSSVIRHSVEKHFI